MWSAAGDLAVVLERVARGVRLGRRVRGVRLVDVEEEEERLVLDRAQPVPRQLERLAPGPLEAAEAGAGAELDAVLVEVEAGREAGLPLQHVGRHGAPGGIPRLLQDLRQERQFAALDLARVELVADIVAHAMHGRQQSRQQRRVRRKGERRRRIGALVEDAVPPHGVDGRRLHPLVAVGRQVVRPQGVDRDQDDRRPLRNVRGSPAAPARAGGEDRNRQQNPATLHGFTCFKKAFAFSISGP